MRVLVINAGSSSLKLRLLDDDDRLAVSRNLDAPGGQADEGALADALSELGGADAIGHRVVHGGPRTEPSVVDAALVVELEALTELAPLHQRPALSAMAATTAAFGGVPAVACFDTAFHANLPAASATYALPARWRERWGLRRYGFHGLSHAWAVRRGADLIDRPLEALRIVSCHLGAGASLAAVAGGRSVDTTMGFTPLDGLVMSSRAGSVDPGLLLWLQRSGGLTADEVADGLESGSGLVGLAGTPDMREVLRRVTERDEVAALALEVYLHRLRGAVAAMAAALGGLEVLVFTGGVGERSMLVRAGVARGLGFLGVAVEEAGEVEPDAEVSAAGATVRTVVVASREDLQIASEVRRLLG